MRSLPGPRASENRGVYKPMKIVTKYRKTHRKPLLSVSTKESKKNPHVKLHPLKEVASHEVHPENDSNLIWTIGD